MPDPTRTRPTPTPARRFSLIRLLPLLLAAVAGCTPDPAPDLATPALSPEAAERMAAWSRERPAEPIPASVAFREILADSTVLRLLDQHQLTPYVAYTWAGGVTTYVRVPPAEAHIEVVAQARADLSDRLERAVCTAPERIRSFLHERAAVSQDSARESSARTMLARLGAEERALEAMRNGSAVLWAVHVVGDVDDLARLGENRRIRAIEPIETTTEEGEVVTGVPRPAEPKPVGELVEDRAVNALSVDELMARLEQIAARPSGNCPPATSDSPRG
jgi:hypothetical protein